MGALPASAEACAICDSDSVTHDAGGGWSLSLPGGQAPLLGWIVAAPAAHRETLAELTDAEAARMGPLLRTLTRLVQAHTGAERSYLANWAEATRHVHFHLVPRPADLAQDRLGANVFQLMSDGSPRPPREHQELLLAEIAAEVRSANDGKD